MTPSDDAPEGPQHLKTYSQAKPIKSYSMKHAIEREKVNIFVLVKKEREKSGAQGEIKGNVFLQTRVPVHPFVFLICKHGN